MTALFTPLRPVVRSFTSLKHARRCYSLVTSDFPRLIGSDSNHFQLYLSGIRDPYLNLSIEHYIYEKSAPNSTILLLYINDPCVVIGRNQNPWLEANLQTLSKHRIPLIRRRSGGGTVFHDHGNVNFSVIYPPADFTRDKYAELVTRALRPYQPRVRVNERHDIVIDQGKKVEDGPRSARLREDMHDSGYEPLQPKKCSGSAYKLSRNRALHHGTCLINSPNLNSISQYLRSPLEPFVKARGVDSVRSPVANVFALSHKEPVDTFIRSVIDNFSLAHQLDITGLQFSTKAVSMTSVQQVKHNFVCGILGQDLEGADEIQKGIMELRSKAWLWGQTPRFSFSTYPTEEDDRERPQLPDDIPSTARLNFVSRSGRVLSADMLVSPSIKINGDALVDKEIDEFESWKDVLQLSPASKTHSEDSIKQVSNLASWLDSMFGKRSTEPC